MEAEHIPDVVFSTIGPLSLAQNRASIDEKTEEKQALSKYFYIEEVRYGLVKAWCREGTTSSHVRIVVCAHHRIQVSMLVTPVQIR